MNSFSHVEEELAENGVLFFGPTAGLNINEKYLSLPFAITDIEAKELGEYLNAFTQQKMYVRTLCGRVEAVIDSIKKEYSATAEKYYLELNGLKFTEVAKEKLIHTKWDIKPHVEKLAEYKSKQNILLKNIESIEDAIFLISREVTRRVTDTKGESRTSNLG